MKTYSRLQAPSVTPPTAKKKLHSEQHHGLEVKDEYFWLKDPAYPQVNDSDVLDYLKAENDYYHQWLEPHKKFVDRVFEEFKGRSQQDDESVPYAFNGYEYRWSYKKGFDYRFYSRRPLGDDEYEVFLDENALAKDQDYFELGDWAISPDNTLLAYSYNLNGDERYSVRIKHLETGEYLKDTLGNVHGSLEFSEDGKHLIYALLDEDKWWARSINSHRLGRPQSSDKVLYEEKDEGYFIGFSYCSSREYLLISSGQGEVQESYVLKANLKEPLQLVVPRSAGFQQSIDHANGQFFILANDSHKNFRLCCTPDSKPSFENWLTLQAGEDQTYLLSLQTFKDFYALKSRVNGYDQIELRFYQGASPSKRIVQFPESLFSASIGANPEFTQSHLRLNYESLVTPKTVFDYDVQDESLMTRKVAILPSGYQAKDYTSERLMVTARDGALIPVSLVYKKGFKKDGTHPLWLYGYGAYGSTVSPTFSSMRLSALDRGFVYAIAHVRGGAMLGYQWYLDGKLRKRDNTFNDFIDVAQELIKQDYGEAGNISISGRSAGGELMGAATIQAPDLWRSVNLGVPFVDVLNTMLDASLPLTPPEWKEWGNPLQNKEDFLHIQSYSPYDNIEPQEYPPMFVSGGLYDPRVTYWEPAKWTAKMRELKEGDNILLMRMNMSSGHFSNSGRYGRLRDYAEEYVFTFLAHGITE